VIKRAQLPYRYLTCLQRMAFPPHADVAVAEEQPCGQIWKNDLAGADTEIHITSREKIRQGIGVWSGRDQYLDLRSNLSDGLNKWAYNGILQIIASANLDCRLRDSRIEVFRCHQRLSIGKKVLDGTCQSFGAWRWQNAMRGSQKKLIREGLAQSFQ